MSTKVRMWIAAMTLLAVGTLVYVAGQGSAGEGKGVGGDIKKIAAAIKGGKADDAKAEAAKVAKKNELETVMEVFKPAKKGGLAVGKIDAIENKIRELARDGSKNIKGEAGDIEELGYI